MPTLVVLYPTPTDPATFERRYQAEHAPMVREHFSQASFKVSRVIGAPGGAPPYGLVVQLGFPSDEAMQAALSTPGGQATAAHANEISTGGPPVFLVCEDGQ